MPEGSESEREKEKRKRTKKRERGQRVAFSVSSFLLRLLPVYGIAGQIPTYVTKESDLCLGALRGRRKIKQSVGRALTPAKGGHAESQAGEKGNCCLAHVHRQRKKEEQDAGALRASLASECRERRAGRRDRQLASVEKKKQSSEGNIKHARKQRINRRNIADLKRTPAQPLQ